MVSNRTSSLRVRVPDLVSPYSRSGVINMEREELNMWLVVEEIHYDTLPNSFIVQSSFLDKAKADNWIRCKNEQQELEGMPKKDYSLFHNSNYP